MLRYNFEKRNGRPLYKYLYECIREDILNGRLPARTKLPSKRELAKENNISIKTVMNAYEQLLVEGYVYSLEKKGYFVAAVEERPQPGSGPQEYPVIYEEQEWEFDFTVNNTVYEKFPFSLWKKTMRDVLAEYEKELVQRAHFQGVRKLRESIADYSYRIRGMRVSPECIVIGSGAEYLYHRLMKLLGTDAVYAMENPGYRKIANIFTDYGLKWHYVEMDENGIEMDDLRKSGADVIHVSPEHNYPLGTVMSMPRRRELLEWASEQPERYIIEDDYDCEFRYRCRMIPTLQSMDYDHRVIYMNTFSKTLAPAIRISYMVLPEELMRRYLDTTNFYSNTASVCEQYALAEFIREGYFERHVSRLKKYYLGQGELLKKIISNSALPVSEIIGGDSGTHLLVRLDTRLSDEEIRRAAQSRGIHIACLSEFCGIVHPRYQHVLVLNYPEWGEEKLIRAIQKLAEIFS